MKYKITPIFDEGKFVPFEITFLIESREEHAILHDAVATRIALSGEFIGHVYHAGIEPISASGVVPLKRLNGKLS